LARNYCAAGTKARARTAMKVVEVFRFGFIPLLEPESNAKRPDAERAELTPPENAENSLVFWH
jgi:hypothetical protein